jgi:glycosyltransferase involved in cell wall biosynthesis
MPKVSVVIPAYNRADLIGETLDSVLAQTFRDFEIVVVDDGSTDGTPAVLARYTDHNVRVIRQENQGEGAARNTGIGAARGDYIALVDSDDLWVPVKLERQMTVLNQRPNLMWVYSDAFVFDSNTGKRLFSFSERGCQYAGDVARELLLRDFIASPTPVIHRSVFQELGMFNYDHRDSDWDMWLRIAAKYPVGLVPEALAGYRLHSGSISQKSGVLLAHQYHVATIERAVKFAPDVYGSVKRQALAAEYLRTGAGLAREGDLTKARKMFLRTIRLSPGTLSVYPRLVASLFGQKFVSFWISRNRERLGLPEKS